MNETNNNNGVYNQSPGNRNAQLSSRSTIALGAILVATLAASYLVVNSRGGNLNASKNGAEAIKQIAEIGLNQYLTKTVVTDYYILEKNDQPVGFAVHYFDPVSDMPVSISGKYLHYFPKLNELSASTYLIYNNMSSWQSKTVSNYMGMRLAEQLEYNNRQLKARYELNGEVTALPDIPVKDGNFIATFMLDFLSSIAAGDEVMFRMPIRIGSFKDCLVQAEGDVPEEIQRLDPDGIAVRTTWIDNQQDIYYSNDHRLLWQRDANNQTYNITRWVTPRELTEIWPQAGEIIGRWQTNQKLNGQVEL